MPNARFATVPHDCQFQSPAQVLVVDSATGVLELLGTELVDDNDTEVNEDGDIEAEDDPSTSVENIVDVVYPDGDTDDIESVDAELLSVLVTRLDRVVLTLVSVVHTATPSSFVVVVTLLSTVIPNSS
jgi:hypothetical protein